MAILKNTMLSHTGTHLNKRDLTNQAQENPRDVASLRAQVLKYEVSTQNHNHGSYYGIVTMDTLNAPDLGTLDP